MPENIISSSLDEWLLSRVSSGSRTILSDIEAARSCPILNVMAAYDTENNS